MKLKNHVENILMMALTEPSKVGGNRYLHYPGNQIMFKRIWADGELGI